MFSKPTVLIIGAGCSAEYRLPVGDGLRKRIVDLLASVRTYSSVETDQSDEQLIAAFQELRGREWGTCLTAARLMQDGLRHAPSIDRYLDFHQSDYRIVEVGKLAVVRTILKAEERSTLRIQDDTGLSLQAVERFADAPHWLGELFQRMQEGASPTNLEDVFSNLTFVCFNYDRCIEHYLYHALRDFAGDEASALKAMRSLRIYHPYGRVGRLPWEATDEEPMPFGGAVNHPGKLISLAREIKTFTERVDERAEISEMREAIRSAHQIAFMGFSFIEQNMDLMTPETRAEAAIVLGTAFEESGPNARLAKSSILMMLKGRAAAPLPGVEIILEDQKAGPFIRDYGNTMRR